jgi:manganese-dependent inorganic pyrophosphatase
MEPTSPAATMLLGAVLSDTVILNSPTTTDRDRAVIAYLEQVLEVEAEAFGREMFERTSNLSSVPVEEIVGRDAKEYEAGAHTIKIAQVETVGEDLHDREADVLEALDEVRRREGHALVALMVTDIIAKGTRLYLSGADRFAIERAFGRHADDGVVELPGVMSRKKQVAPRLLAAVG